MTDSSNPLVLIALRLRIKMKPATPKVARPKTREAVEFWIAPHRALHFALGRGAFEVRQMLAGEEPDQVGC